ncbi:hypothetical protein GCM10008960_01200 [Deinococcus sedimenti]|uniref:Uncharacterized protein n=1 Tax=Deinococcus sedimenti TaxID=1867090 RepID=A0ABQ2RXH5_9DEIO|nr:hypothetical protein GCM10008960_01200 [Deinococcus sedimenti]
MRELLNVQTAQELRLQTQNPAQGVVDGHERPVQFHQGHALPGVLKNNVEHLDVAFRHRKLSCRHSGERNGDSGGMVCPNRYSRADERVAAGFQA